MYVPTTPSANAKCKKSPQVYFLLGANSAQSMSLSTNVSNVTKTNFMVEIKNNIIYVKQI